MPAERHGPILIAAPERLNSWKEIAQYLRISIRTAQRWERLEHLPVHRHYHEADSTVYANRAELDAWLITRGGLRPAEGGPKRSRLTFLAVSAVIIACLVYCAIALARSDHPYLAPDYRSRPFATGLPSQWFPAWSRDGKRIAYIGEKDGNRRLMVQAVDSPLPAAISPPALQLADRQFPFWSPDSEWVYCIGSLNDGNKQMEAHLYRAPAGGGDPVLVQAETRAATVSPDGRTLVTLSRSADGNWGIWTATPPESPLQRYEPQPIRAGAYFQRPTLAFAPRGDRILLAINLPALGPQYWLLPWPSGKPQALPFPRMGFLNFAWMPDSRHLLALNGRRPELFLADTESGSFSALTKLDRRPAYPTASPDGSRLAYQSQLSHTDVIAVPLDGGAIRSVVDSPATEEMPSCSPASDELVFLTDRRGGSEMWIHSLKDSSSRPVYAAVPDPSLRSLTAGAPAFSPDGRQVAVRVALNAAMSGIVVAAVRGESAVLTVFRAPAVFVPAWSPDGKWLIFVQQTGGAYRVMKIRSDGSGQAVELAETSRSQGVPAPFSPPEWSPDGDWIAFEDEWDQLTLISPDGKSRRRLGGTGPVAWSRDGRTLYQVRYEDHALVAIDITTGARKVLRALGNAIPYAFTEPGRRISLTRDGRDLVYSVLRPRDEIWIVEGLRPHPPWYMRLWPK